MKIRSGCRGLGAIVAVGALAVGLAFIGHLMLKDDLIHVNDGDNPIEMTEQSENNDQEEGFSSQGSNEDSGQLGLPTEQVTISELNHADGSFVFIHKRGWYLFNGSGWIEIEQKRIPADINERYPYPFQFGVDETCLLDK